MLHISGRFNFVALICNQMEDYNYAYFLITPPLISSIKIWYGKITTISSFSVTHIEASNKELTENLFRPSGLC